MSCKVHLQVASVCGEICHEVVGDSGSSSSSSSSVTRSQSLKGYCDAIDRNILVAGYHQTSRGVALILNGDTLAACAQELAARYYRSFR